MTRPLVVIPTYNEVENLVPIVTRLRTAAPGVDVLVVDDGSPDGTGDLADLLADADPAVHVLHHGPKRGLGRAYLDGFAWGMARDYLLLVEMDADGSHHPEALPEMLAVAEEVDVVLGSRWVPGGRVEHWSWHRHLLSRGGNLYARLALGIDVRDATGGFRVYRAATLRALDLAGVRSAGYSFQLDLLWRALCAGMRVVEVPITFTERRLGSSKMSGAIVREAILSVSAWGARRRLAALNARLRGRPLPPVRRRPGLLQRLVPLA